MSHNIIETKNLVFKTKHYDSTEEAPFNLTLGEAEVGVIVNKKLARQIGRHIFGRGSLISGELNYAQSIQYSKKNNEWKENIGFCFREEGIFAAQTVYQNVNLPVKFYNKDESLTIQALLDIGIPQEVWELRPHLTSLEIRKKILIARSAVLNPKFIFMDDPMALLDLESKKAFHKWIKKQKAKGTAILIGTDEIHTALIYADWILGDDHNNNYEFKELYSDNQYQIAKLLKEEFLKEI